RLDLLVQNAAVSNTRKGSLSLQEYAQISRASNASLDEVRSAVGSLTSNADPAYPYHPMFGPVYAGSKAALNAITLAMMVELESTGIKVNLVSPGFTRTNLNGYAGTQSVEEGSLAYTSASTLMRLVSASSTMPSGPQCSPTCACALNVQLKDSAGKLIHLSPYSGREDAFEGERTWLAPGAGTLIRTA
ncbi:MAG: short-chain dehydrogenase/reductase, partial [Candidatus Solibacter sp.]|nr:short-chain dehydrogenase/reductase [Candidatus Solibacter sp.]